MKNWTEHMPGHSVACVRGIFPVHLIEQEKISLYRRWGNVKKKLSNTEFNNKYNYLSISHKIINAKQ